MMWLKLGARGLLGLAILAVALGVWTILVKTKPKAPRTEAPDLALQVRAITAEPVAAPRVWTGYGTARPDEAADVSAEVAAVVVRRPDDIEPGVWVERGTLLAQLDDTEYAAALTRANELVQALEADLRGLDVEAESISDSLALAEERVRLAQSQLNRLRSAVGAGGASRFEIEALEERLTTVKRERESLEERLNLIPTRKARLRAQLESERANARVARLNVERCSISAPITGILQSVEVEEGERVGIGQPIARVVDLRSIEVPLRLPVSAATRLRLGDRAALEHVGAEPAAWEGAIGRIAPEADPATRTITAFAEVEQEVREGVGERARLEGMLLPGQFLSATVFGQERSPRLVVPRNAVQRDRVLIANEEDRVEPRLVTVAYHIDALFPDLHPHERQWAVIDSGLDPGARVIISNLDDLTAGTPVRPTEVRGLLAGGNGGSES